MSGYRLPERTVRVQFEGTDYDGAEVVLTLSIRLGDYITATKLKDNQDFETLIPFIAGWVKSWNLEDDDGPIPPTAEGILRLNDLGFLMAVLNAWEQAMRGVTSVDGPLGELSPVGTT